MRDSCRLVVAALLVVSCSPGTVDGSTTSSTMAIPVAPSSVETASTTTSSAPPTQGAEVIDVAPLGGLGGLPGGNPQSTIRLGEGDTYRFPELLPVLVFEPPNAHWEVRGYTPSSVRIRWRGESGAHPGTLVVVVFAGRTDPVEAVWADLEAEVSEGLERVGRSLEWIGTGVTSVGGIDGVEWREFRTGSERPRDFDSAPCVVTVFDGECVWFESGARLLVVGVGDLSVPILVTEQMCECDLGGLGTYRKTNDLDDHLGLIEATLRALRFSEG